MSLISEPKLIDFDDVRADLREEAAAIIKTALDRSAPSQFPMLIHLCGIPGAGKTTYAGKLMNNEAPLAPTNWDRPHNACSAAPAGFDIQNGGLNRDRPHNACSAAPAGFDDYQTPHGDTTSRGSKRCSESAEAAFVCVQFDIVMEKLSGYQRDKSKLGLVEAFRLWELPARAIGYHLLQTLIENRRNVLFDHSATNRSHIDLIGAVKDRGYRVEMHYIQCAPSDAAVRVRQREALIERHTPEELVYQRYDLLQELLPVYQKLVDRFHVVDASRRDSRMIPQAVNAGFVDCDTVWSAGGSPAPETPE